MLPPEETKLPRGLELEECNGGVQFDALVLLVSETDLVFHRFLFFIFFYFMIASNLKLTLWTLLSGTVLQCLLSFDLCIGIMTVLMVLWGSNWVIYFVFGAA